jgi:hypothetical protein
VTAPVVPLRPADDIGAAAHEALGVVSRHLDRCKLSARTVRAYKRQAAAYAGWLAANASAHGDAFADLIGAEGAVTAWKRTCSPPGPARRRSTRRWPPSR